MDLLEQVLSLPHTAPDLEELFEAPMTPEGSILRTVLDWLVAERILAFRMNTGAAKIDGRFMRFGTPGMADIVAYPTSCAVPAVIWVECKAAKGKQSELQKSFQKLVEGAGHVYIIARSVDDVEKWLKENGAI